MIGNQTTDYAEAVKQSTPEEEACRIVRQEKAAWENSVVYITPEVAFNLPVLLRTLLKNYYGVFDEPTDTLTGQDKLWVPLTETLCETTIKNVDLDTKDINFRALTAEGVGYTQIVRAAVRQALNGLSPMTFGEKLNEFIRHMTIWGTSVWSTENVEGKIDLRIVNLLNFYIEPTSPSIAEADKATERFPMTISEFRVMAKRNQWKNWEDVTGRKNVPRYDTWLQLQNYPADSYYVEVYRLRGMIPNFIFTDNGEDREELVAGELVVSWDNGTWRFHDASLRKDNKNKGYEEAWLTRVPQRWLGKGIAEKALPLQVYANTLLNVRKTRAQVSQLGLFKVKRGSGVTAQSLQRLAVNGAVLVNNMEDVQQFVMQEMGASSYKDEDVMWNWAQRVTQAQEITAGDTLPASTPATNAAIQNTQAQGAYAMVKENTGMMLERWLKNQALPIIMKSLTVGKIVRLTGDSEIVRELDDHLVNLELVKQIEKATQEGKAIDPLQVEKDKLMAMEKLRKMGDERFITLKEFLNPLDYDCEVMITNEKVDEGVMSQRLIQALQLAPEEKDQILPSLFDILGIPYKPSQQPSLAGLPQGQSQVPNTLPTPQSVATQGNVPAQSRL